MDGVFDLFHIGHLEAIRQCAALGDRVILGVTGDSDAEGYKRKPIVPETERTAIVAALEEVDAVVCLCPLIVQMWLLLADPHFFAILDKASRFVSTAVRFRQRSLY